MALILRGGFMPVFIQVFGNGKRRIGRQTPNSVSLRGGEREVNRFPAGIEREEDVGLREQNCRHGYHEPISRRVPAIELRWKIANG